MSNFVQLITIVLVLPVNNNYNGSLWPLLWLMAFGICRPITFSYSIYGSLTLVFEMDQFVAIPK